MSVLAPAHVLPVLERAVAQFRQKFGRSPRYAAQAPGRVNLIGEHTDYNSGLVLPMAIERCCVVVADDAQDVSLSRIFADAIGEQHLVDLRRRLVPQDARSHGAECTAVQRGTWASHILGVTAQFQKRGANAANLDAVIASSVPLGGGLASSASLEVAWALLMSQRAARMISGPAIAELCQAASHEYVGVPCGIMDQFISAVAEEGKAALIDCRDNSFEQIAMPRAGAIVIADTGKKHSHAGGEYAKRAAACREAAKILGVPSLREVELENLTGTLAMLGKELTPLAEHVVGENARVSRFAAALQAGDLKGAGENMSKSHESLKTLYRVSCDELDAMVEIAGKVAGVYGARMTGGGFGGCIVALVEPQAVGPLVETLRSEYRTPMDTEPQIFSTRAAQGAGRIEL